jgi:lysophospholipid acyltransferase (LPLAT)-like uncharacterized protein
LKRKKKLTLKQRLRQLVKQPWLIQVGAKAAAWFLAAVSHSWRVSLLVHPQTQALLTQKQPVIFALWHGRMFCLLHSIDPAQTAILISGSNDGEFITQTVRPLGFRHFIRGSSKRHGTKAALAMVKTIKDSGLSVATTIDGPMGPRYKVKPSLARLAYQLQVPIVPVTASALPYLFWLRRSWDHYMGPAPFSRLHVVLGQPITMDNEPGDSHHQSIEHALNRSTQMLDCLCGYQTYWHNGEAAH